MKPPTEKPSMETPPFVAVVTGSSSGIGQAMALELASRGAHVLVHARANLQGLMQTAEQIRNHESNQQDARPVRCILADVRSVASIDSMVRAAFAWRGYVNLWVHAAGADVLTGNAAIQSFEEKLQHLWETDVRGTILTSRRVAQNMISHGVPHSTLPSMVLLGWDQAEHGMEGDSGQYFCPIKSAVAAFSKSLAKSVAPHVRVNCIAPGWIQTEWGLEATDPWSSRAQREALLDRWGNPADVARIVAAISMGDGEFINAQTIAVNGGWCSGADHVRSRNTHEPRPFWGPR
jgi:3-oxoacyl-[acyl-carrier protein] reductase